jgi:methylated-DNA-[protein]-cysteine S-methyltransferase
LQKTVKYTIFETKWGYFGLAGCENALVKTHLPCRSSHKIESYLLADTQTAKYDKSRFASVERMVKAYFAEDCVDFSDLAVRLDHFSEFTQKVLTACRKITRGQTISYSQLAQKIAHPGSSRAVGSALAKNPLPLIIPCHRVIRADGNPGGFSALGGTKLKSKLILHETKSANRGNIR